MSGLLVSFAWCSLQVTVIALLAWLLCGLARRMSSSHAAALPATALAAVIVLTALAFVPWPRGWSYGPELSWRKETEQSDEYGVVSAKEELPAEQVPPLAANAIHQPEIAPVPAVELLDPTKDDAATNSHLNTAPDNSPALSPQAIPTPATPPIAPPSPPLPRAWPWPAILLSLLGLGAAAGLFQLLAGLIAAQSYRRKSSLIEDKGLHELADVLCAQLRCRARVELRETSSLATAATIGWTRPLVLLPLEWRDWTAEQLRAVLAHEIAHIARHDFLACVLAQAGLALHFYHPLVHWLVRRLRLEQELAADAAAAMATGGRAAYLQALAELALRQSERPLGWPARTFLPTRGTFMRRIEMLRDAKNGPAGESRWLAWPRRAAVLLLIMGAVAVAGLRGGAPPGDVAQAQDEPKVKEESKAKEPQEAQPDSGEISVAQLPSDCFAFAAIRVQPFLKNPETAEVLRKLDLRTAESRAALPLERIAQITMTLAVRGGERIEQSEPVVIVETTSPADFTKALIIEGGPKTDIEEVKEADLARGADMPGFVHTRLGDKAAVFGRRPDIARFLSRKRGGPPLVRGDGWKQVSRRPLVVAIDMMAYRRLAPSGLGASLEQAGLKVFWDETESIALGVALEKKADIRLVAECLGEKGAAQVEETADGGAIILRNLLREMRASRISQEPLHAVAGQSEEHEFVNLLFDAADKALSNVKVERQETLITASASIDLKGRIGALSALVPSVHDLRLGGRRAQSANNIKQIMLAMHNYADTYKHFPPAVIYGRDGKGKVPHSWRVELLPFLEQDALYKAYQFDEPWDSEANKKILAQMPAVFRDPSADLKSTSSAYYVMVGKAADRKKDEGGGGAGAAAPMGAAAFGIPAGGEAGGVIVDAGLPTAFSKKEGIRFAEITDGTSNTLAIVEAKRDVPWTKPEDISYDPKGKGPKLGGFYGDGFHAGFCDGAVRFLPANTSEESLRAYLSPAAGEPISLPQPKPALELRVTPVDKAKPRPAR